MEAANPREGPLNPVVAVPHSWKEQALAKGEMSIEGSCMMGHMFLGAGNESNCTPQPRRIN